jgi:hypothetical protein
MTKGGSYGGGNNNNINQYNPNNNFNRNPGKPQTNEQPSNVGGNNVEQQVIGTIKSLMREKRCDKVPRGDLCQALKDKFKDPSQLNKILSEMLSDGYLLEEDGLISILS